MNVAITIPIWHVFGVAAVLFLIGFTGVAIVETDNPEELNSWLIQWNNIVDIETTPVVDDTEARDFGRKTMAASA